MKKNISVIVAIFIICSLVFLKLTTPDKIKTDNIVAKSNVNNVQSGEVLVIMGVNEYTPVNLIIKKGTTVKFENYSGLKRWPASDLHPAHEAYSAFDPKMPIMDGDSWTFVFDQVGEWGYHDHLAPYILGIIKVVE